MLKITQKDDGSILIEPSHYSPALTRYTDFNDRLPDFLVLLLARLPLFGRLYRGFNAFAGSHFS